jgi:predicted nucleic-acid-binding protein
MLAVDTNVLVRYIVADDARQAERARTVIDGEDVFIPTSVILEVEWVLRSTYGFAFAAVADAVRTIAGQPTVTLEAPLVVQTALGWSEAGVDFADALHMAASQHCEAFVSFDRDLIKSGKRARTLEVREP